MAVQSFVKGDDLKKLIDDKPYNAIPLPVIPAINPCVSLVGIPNTNAVKANITTEIIPLTNAIIPKIPAFKFTILLIVLATEIFHKLMEIIPTNIKKST